MVEMMVGNDGGLTVRSSACGELCLGRRGGGKQEFGPPASAPGCASPWARSLPVLGLCLAGG